MRNYLLREWHLIVRQKNLCWQPFLFFILIVAVFPMGLIPETKILTAIGAGVIWMAVLLAVLMGLPHLLVSELEDGSVEQWLLSDENLMTRLLCKLFAAWGFFILPLLLAAPLLALLYHFSMIMILVLECTLLLATPILWWLGGLMAALTVSLNASSILLVLLLLPLYVPVLIFAAGAVNAASMGLPFLGPLALLAALSLVLIVVVPILMQALLKMAVELL